MYITNTAITREQIPFRISFLGFSRIDDETGIQKLDGPLARVTNRTGRLRWKEVHMISFDVAQESPHQTCVVKIINSKNHCKEAFGFNVSMFANVGVVSSEVPADQLHPSVFKIKKNHMGLTTFRVKAGQDVVIIGS